MSAMAMMHRICCPPAGSLPTQECNNLLQPIADRPRTKASHARYFSNGSPNDAMPFNFTRRRLDEMMPRTTIVTI